MKNQMMLDINFLKKKFALFLGIGLLIMLVGTFVAAATHVSTHGLIDYWDIAYRPFVSIFPVMCIIPCYYLFEEKQSGMMRMALLRTTKKKYFASKFLVGSLFTFLLVFLVGFIGIFFVLLIPESIIIVSPPAGFDDGTTWYDHILGYEYYVNNPVFYAFVVSFWRGLVGVIFYFLGVVTVFLVNNKFQVVIIPFVYYWLQFYFWSLLGYPEKGIYWSVCYFTPDNGFLVWGPIMLVIALFIVYLYKIRKKTFSLIK